MYKEAKLRSIPLSPELNKKVADLAAIEGVTVTRMLVGLIEQAVEAKYAELNSERFEDDHYIEADYSGYAKWFGEDKKSYEK